MHWPHGGVDGLRAERSLAHLAQWTIGLPRKPLTTNENNGHSAIERLSKSATSLQILGTSRHQINGWKIRWGDTSHLGGMNTPDCLLVQRGA